jgi:membrane protease YdiL (CAAX protease family)
MNNIKNIRYYLILLFVLSYAWQYAIYLTGGVDSSLFPYLMWFPSLLAIIFRIRTKQGFRDVGWGLRKWWYLFPAILVSPVVVSGISILSAGCNWAYLSERYFIFHDSVVDIPTIPLILGNHPQSLYFFALNITISLFLQSILGSLFTFGEEFGWRGYLQEKFIRKFGLKNGLVLLGIIWGYWHLPVILMGYNFPDNPILGAFLLMPLGTTFMGIFLGWLYLRSKSIWTAVLAHASMNLTAVLLFNMLVLQNDSLLLQILWIAAWGIVAGVCILSMSIKSPVLWQKTNATEKPTQPYDESIAGAVS